MGNWLDISYLLQVVETRAMALVGMMLALEDMAMDTHGPETLAGG